MFPPALMGQVVRVTRAVLGGRRRIDRVLDPLFITDLESVPAATLRQRRFLADQEEADLSYLRRILHGRIDLLTAELRRHHEAALLRDAPARRTDEERKDDDLIHEVSAILADVSRPSRGGGRYMPAMPSRVGFTRRSAERAAHDLGWSDPRTQSRDQLNDTLIRLRAQEREISRLRSDVHHVIDVITDEVARRYRAGVVSGMPQPWIDERH